MQEDSDDFSTLSVYGGFCADISLVREHLDSGVLLKLTNDKKAKMDAASGPFGISWDI